MSYEEVEDPKKRSALIEKYLEEERKKFALEKREPKLLILGSSDSGKSTLLKQLKILHGSGFTSDEKIFARCSIRKSILSGCARLLELCESDALRTVSNLN